MTADPTAIPIQFDPTSVAVNGDTAHPLPETFERWLLDFDAAAAA